jgi:hypothetical protein
MAAIDPFYLGLYQRGMTQFDAGDFSSASRELRLAAFGLVDSLEQFETAHIYAAIAASKAGRSDDAKVSVERIISAERVTRTYSHLVIPAPVRTQFEAIAKTSLAPAAYAFLTMPDAPPPPRVTPRVVVQVPPGIPAATFAAPSSASTPTYGNHAASDPPEKERPSGLSKSLADAEHAISSGDLAKARAIYATQLEAPGLSHGDLLRVGEGLYRSHDFTGAVRAFTRAGEPTKGEEINHYYFAVSLYESGQYGAAKRELMAALPFIEKTPDVKRYQAKIEGAVVE